MVISTEDPLQWKACRPAGYGIYLVLFWPLQPHSWRICFQADEDGLPPLSSLCKMEQRAEKIANQPWRAMIICRFLSRMAHQGSPGSVARPLWHSCPQAYEQRHPTAHPMNRHERQVNPTAIAFDDNVRKESGNLARDSTFHRVDSSRFYPTQKDAFPCSQPTQYQ